MTSYISGMQSSDINKFTEENVWFLLKFSESGLTEHNLEGNGYSGFLKTDINVTSNPLTYIDTTVTETTIFEKPSPEFSSYLWQIKKVGDKYKLYNKQSSTMHVSSNTSVSVSKFLSSYPIPGFFNSEISVDLVKSKKTSWLQIEEFGRISVSSSDGYSTLASKLEKYNLPTRHLVTSIALSTPNGAFEVFAVDISTNREIFSSKDAARAMFFDLAGDPDSAAYDLQQANYFYNKCKKIWAKGPSNIPREEEICQMFFMNIDPAQRAKFVFEDTQRCVLPVVTDGAQQNIMTNDPIFKMACSGLNDGGKTISVEKCYPYISKIGAGIQEVKEFNRVVLKDHSYAPNVYIKTDIGKKYCERENMPCGSALSLWAASDLPDVTGDEAAREEMCTCYWTLDKKKALLLKNNPALDNALKSSVPIIAELAKGILAMSADRGWGCHWDSCKKSKYKKRFRDMEATKCPDGSLVDCLNLAHPEGVSSIVFRGDPKKVEMCKKQLNIFSEVNCDSASGTNFTITMQGNAAYCCGEGQTIVDGKCFTPKAAEQTTNQCENGEMKNGICVCKDGYVLDSVTGKCVVIPAPTTPKVEESVASTDKVSENILSNYQLWMAGGVAVIVFMLLIILLVRKA